MRGRRWWNVRTPERYLDRIRSGRSAEAAAEVLGDGDRRLEALQLSLRTSAGVPASALSSRDRDELDGLLVAVGDGRLALTPRGRLLANEVAVRLRAP
jgi:oxygen-independent coproporphyrinogen-3 oxidase